jgi:outer membrane protein insertion porin family
MRSACGWLMVAAALCILVWPPAARAQAALEGQTVLSVQVVDQAGAVQAGPLPPLALQASKPFDIQAEQQSLRSLYATGRFAGIHTVAENAPGGLEIEFVVSRNFYNGVVTIDGLNDSWEISQAQAAMRLNVGGIFYESDVHAGIARVNGVLVDDGLYQASSSYALVPHPGTRQMDVVVHVAPGLHARAGQVIIQNQTGYPSDQLLDRAKFGPGKEITSTSLSKSSDRLRKFLASEGHLGGRVNIMRGDYDAKTNLLPLTYAILAGPKVSVTVDGAKFSQSEIKKLVPIFEEGAVDEDLLQEGRRNLRDALEREGYFDARVQFQSSSVKSQEQVIAYSVDRGQLHRLLGFDFDGNKYFSSEVLSSRLSIRPAAFSTRGHFSDELLSNDTDSLRALYVSNGFLSAMVTAEKQDDYRGKAGDLFIRFHIKEGSQTRVAKLTIIGNRALSSRDLLSVIGSTPGQPYSDANVTGDRDNILAFYYNEGFPGASFQAKSEDAAPGFVDLTYTIVEGAQVRVDQVLLTGYEYTRRGIIARQVSVKPGGPLRESDVIETQRKLYNLGIFNRVTVAPQNPDGVDTDKNVVVQVEEAKRYTMSYGFGVEAQNIGGSGGPVSNEFNISPRGIFEISRNNLGGRDQSISLQLRGSTLEYRGLLTYTIPDFFAYMPFSLQVTGYADKSRDVQTFSATRYQASVQLSQHVTPFTTLLYRYTYRHIIVDTSTLEIPEEEIPLFSQPTRVSGPGFTWLRDHKNSPSDTTKGTFNTIDVSVAIKALGSSASFYRVFYQNSSFTPIGRSIVFARSFRFGAEIPIEGSLETDVPLPERFFAGGGNTLRGFGLNQAGPRDPITGFPIGGLAEMIFNQELRFPMHLPIVGDRLGGTLFYDAGNVYGDVDKITFRYTPRSESDLEYMSHTVGFGVRYPTPIGPVRLDLGYQLNPPEFEFVTQHLFPRYVVIPETGQLPHFQFFFNIGSIF